VKTTLLFLLSSLVGIVSAGEVEFYLSTARPTADGSRWSMKPQRPLPWRAVEESNDFRIDVDPTQSFQTILGLGTSLEPTTCFNIHQLAPADQDEVIQRLVNPQTGIGMNLMRVCIGTPDFTGDPWYSYNDLPEGQTDPKLEQFSIEKDKAYILPVLQKTAAARKDLLFFASPWSPPGWMKTTGNMIGGKLKREWYASYAQYFVKFIQAYESLGIPIYAVTIQNEPGVDRNLEKDTKWWYPSCRWTGEEERDFIRDHLSPALSAAGLSTKIWCYDHNYNVAPTADGDDPGLGYPRTILSDPKTFPLVAGVAFHGYAGKPENMLLFQQEFPKTPLHFTEGSVFTVVGGAKLVAILRAGAVSYNAWVTMSDTKGKPNNGPFDADTTCIQRDLETNKPIYNFDLDLMGHFTKFIVRDSVRIDSQSPNKVSNVAFRRPDGSICLVIVHPPARHRTMRIRFGKQEVIADIPGSSVATLVWTPSP
jgi:glucosylceramidase